jgi:hypothetical protein
VPLSEHEQRLLDQIERALYQDDPKFASTVRSSDLRTHMKRRLRRAAVILVIGFVLLLAGVVIHPVVGVAGFVVMLGALLLALSSWKRLGSTTPSLRAVSADGTTGRERRTGRSAKPRARKSGGSGGSLLGRLEERWNKRWDERGRD